MSFSHSIIFLYSIVSTDCSNPWVEDQEPQDLYRNIEHIQMIDIQYYNNFMSAKNKENNNLQVSSNTIYKIIRVYKILHFSNDNIYRDRKV